MGAKWFEVKMQPAITMVRKEMRLLLRRLLWTIPATAAGCLVFAIWAGVALDLPNTESVIRATLFAHGIAWLFLIAPFAMIFPARSRLYNLPLSLLYGAILGALAYVAFCFVVSMLLGIPRLAWDAITSDSWVIGGCACSGAVVAAALSGFAQLERRSAKVGGC